MQIHVKVRAGDQVAEWDTRTSASKLTVLKDKAGEFVQVFASHNPEHRLLTEVEKQLLKSRLLAAITTANREQKPMTVNLEIGGV